MLESQAAASVFREYSRHSSECSKDAIDSAAVYTHDDDDDELQNSIRKQWWRLQWWRWWQWWRKPFSLMRIKLRFWQPGCGVAHLRRRPHRYPSFFPPAGEIKLLEYFSNVFNCICLNKVTGCISHRLTSIFLFSSQSVVSPIKGLKVKRRRQHYSSFFSKYLQKCHICLHY